MVWQSNCKYLGHCINETFIDGDDMARQRKQIYAQGNALVRKFCKCNRQNVTVQIVLLLLVHKCVTVQLPLWGGYLEGSQVLAIS